MDCPVRGCMANDHGATYCGRPQCMQPFSGDPAAFRRSVEGCIMNGSSKSLEERVKRLEDAVRELNPGLNI